MLARISVSSFVILSALLFSAALAKVPEKEDAVRLVEYTTEQIAIDFTGVVSKINAGDGEYLIKDYENLYVFIYDEDLNMIAHPVKTKLIGKNFSGKKDAAGIVFRDSIKIKALAAGQGWQEYIYQKPTGEGLQFEKKTTYFKLVKAGDRQYFICSGVYAK